MIPHRITLALTLILTALCGCVEISNIVSPPPKVEEPDWDTFFGDQDAGDETPAPDADSGGADDTDSNGPADADTNSVDDIDTDGTGDADTNGTDTDSNGEEGIPALPDGAELTTTDSGLQYYDFEVGTGAMPAGSDAVRVAYTGYLPDGTVFDSNENALFGLNNLIPGFTEGVSGMQVGGRRRLIIPPDLGYGEGGNAGAGIGGEDTIVFDVELLGIE